MKIIRFVKKKLGIYTIYLDNDSAYDLYEEIILKEELLLQKNIEKKDLDILLQENKNWECYYQALNCLKKVLKTKKELSLYLAKKQYNSKQIEFALKKLIDQKYLDDKVYARSFINNRIMTTTKGPKRIAQELEQKGISPPDYLDVLNSEYNEEKEIEKITKIVSKKTISNRNKSSKILKQKLEQELLIQGFNPQIIKKYLNSYEFPTDKIIAQKEYQKYYQKLSRKYQGKELEYKLKQKMFNLGFINYYDE
ncbi:MAG TPA: RecX family transcriptional regulator [Candidatus Onthousia faecavium]|nr:RecX family transcriptional regulator [Candidatus Onthousia faecavium]